MRMTICHNLRWHKGKSKFYEVRLSKDLFGDWLITCVWGSLLSRMGNYRTHYFDTKQAALLFIDSLSKRRARRGYDIVSPLHYMNLTAVI